MPCTAGTVPVLDAGVAGAGDGVVVGIVGLPEPRAFGDEAMQALRPLMTELVDVVAAHLIDGDQHDELRLGRGGGRGGPRRSARAATTAASSSSGHESGGLFHDRRHESYNQPVSKRRLISAARPRRWLTGGQPGRADPIARRCAEARRRSYVADIPQAAVGHRRRGNLSAGDRINTGSQFGGGSRARSRTLRVGPAAGQAGRFRSPRRAARCVRSGRQAGARSPGAARSTAARSDGDGDAQIGAIIAESARYNIGSITAKHQHAADGAAVSGRRQPAPIPLQARRESRRRSSADARDAADQRRRRCSASRRRCGRSNTRSAAATRSSRRPDGGDRPAHGRFWINPSNGSVLISELIVDGGGVIATVTVSYQSEPLMGFLVPVEMRESYIRHRERISGHAGLRQVPADRKVS